MRSIISVVGKSSSGKTTLLEKLIAELKKRGYKVAIVKHSHHKDDLDTAAKDTWRFTKAGSELSVINSLDHLAIYRRMDNYFDPQDISNFVLWDFDILLTEGFKSSNYPKIEVHRNEQGQELLTDPKLLLAVVTDKPLDISMPQFSHDDVAGIADIIEKTIISQNNVSDLEIVVDGVPAKVSPYLKDVLARTLSAMIPDSQNNGEVKNLHISLRRKH
ncbi:MAG: molybdopterin-guanine dinucleotide biosynthesis protein B [Chloroflexi bacterium RBG_13_51_18]|nr:MAG: molybdopterin-guanine dinucleotide biosynthesis protein B [Chloroflexi bacterium RBG_13_51_18]